MRCQFDALAFLKLGVRRDDSLPPRPARVPSVDVPVASIAPENAREHFGWLAGFLAADVPVSSALTREWLGWQPSHPGLIEDLEQDRAA